MSSTATKEVPRALPVEVEELVERSVDSMSETELREFEKQAAKIMKESKRRLNGSERFS